MWTLESTWSPWWVLIKSRLAPDWLHMWSQHGVNLESSGVNLESIWSQCGHVEECKIQKHFWRRLANFGWRGPSQTSAIVSQFLFKYVFSAMVKKTYWMRVRSVSGKWSSESVHDYHLLIHQHQWMHCHNHFHIQLHYPHPPPHCCYPPPSHLCYNAVDYWHGLSWYLALSFACLLHLQ